MRKKILQRNENNFIGHSDLTFLLPSQYLMIQKALELNLKINIELKAGSFNKDGILFQEGFTRMTPGMLGFESWHHYFNTCITLGK